MAESKSLGRLMWEIQGRVLEGKGGFSYRWEDIKAHERQQLETIAEEFAQAVLSEQGTLALSREYRTRIAMDEPIATALAGVPGMTIREITGITVAIEHAVLAALAAWEG